MEGLMLISALAVSSVSLVDIYRKIVTLVQATKEAAASQFVTLTEAVLEIVDWPPEVRWYLVVDDPIPDFQRDHINQQIEDILPSWSTDDIGALLMFGMIMNDSIKVDGITVRFRHTWGWAGSPMSSILPEDHIEAFLDLARRQDEAGFKDLARMVCANLSPDEVNAMWTGTVRRLHRESVLA